MTDRVEVTKEQAEQLDRLLESFDGGPMDTQSNITPAVVGVIAAVAVANAGGGAAASDLDKLKKARDLLDSLDSQPSIDELKEARKKLVVT